MFNPQADPEGGKSDPPRARGGVPSDYVCPWCGETQLWTQKKMPDPRGPGILAYIFFPVAVLLWLGTPTYNNCPKCGGRWQRGVNIEAAPGDAGPPPPETRAGMYAEPVPTPAVVRRRARLQPERAAAPASSADEVELRAPVGSCRVCRQAAGRYDARDVPPIPVPGCNCETGCRCEQVPVEAS